MLSARGQALDFPQAEVAAFVLGHARTHARRAPSGAGALGFAQGNGFERDAGRGDASLRSLTFSVRLTPSAAFGPAVASLAAIGCKHGEYGQALR